MAFKLAWELCRVDAATGEKIVTAGEQDFATLAALRTAARTRLDGLALSDLKKGRILLIVT